MHDRDLANLRRLDAAKRDGSVTGSSLGEAVALLFHQQVDKRHTKIGVVAEVWSRVVPDSLQEHACIESLSRGRLTVLVDTAAHLYQLRQLMLAGLEKQILVGARGSGVRRIALKRGRWYDDDGNDCF
jgi:hypothetical protein